MGINIGTCIVTAFYCFVGGSHRDSRRTGLVHVLFNTIGTVVFMILMSVMQHFQVFGTEFWTMEASSTVIAIFQSLFNVFTCVLLLPFTNQLVKIAVTVVKDEPKKAPSHPELLTLSENLYISPAVALNEATKAVVAMGTVAKENFARGCRQLLDFSSDLDVVINEDEECLDRFADDSDHFLIGLSKVVENTGDDRQLDMLLQSVPNFERIGDYATNFSELGQKLQESGNSFSDDAKKELQILFDAVNEILAVTLDAFTRDDIHAAKAVEPLEEVIDDMIILLKDRHTKRLKKGLCTVDTGLIFMECLTYLERASDQCSSIAVMMLARFDDAILHNHHDYLRSVHNGNDVFFNEEESRRREQYITPLKKIS
jgi:phosphate:Na+ symporter